MITVPVLNPDSPHMAVFFFDGDDWHALRLPITSVAASTVIDHDIVTVAYLAAADNSRQDVNSVFVVGSADAGKSWDEPHLVWRSGVRPASSVRLRMAPNGALHLLWAQQDSSGAPVLRHFVRRATGDLWASVDEFSLKGGFNALQVATDACSQLHVVFENYPRMGPEGSLTFSTWAGSWAKPSGLFAAWRPIEPALSMSPTGKIRLTMLARLGSDPFNPTYQQLWVEAP
jgi:hypothetical protein